LGRAIDRFFRWIITLGSAVYGLMLLDYAATTDAPFKVVFFFVTSVAFFGASYWWMYDSKKVNANGW
jgi:hypothetical protein